MKEKPTGWIDRIQEKQESTVCVKEEKLKTVPRAFLFTSLAFGSESFGFFSSSKQIEFISVWRICWQIFFSVIILKLFSLQYYYNTWEIILIYMND